MTQKIRHIKPEHHTTVVIETAMWWDRTAGGHYFSNVVHVNGKHCITQRFQNGTDGHAQDTALVRLMELDLIPHRHTHPLREAGYRVEHHVNETLKRNLSTEEWTAPDLLETPAKQTDHRTDPCQKCDTGNYNFYRNEVTPGFYGECDSCGYVDDNN